MPTLSLSMIVKDEARTIARVIECARPFCDELIVVDTGSTDGTVDILKNLGVQVYHFAWVDHFAKARNESLSHCTGDWVLWLDADDVIPSAQQQRFLEIKQTVLSDELDLVFMPYHVHFNAQGEPTIIQPNIRLFRRASGAYWTGAIHEHLVCEAPRTLSIADCFVEHRTHPDKCAEKEGRNLRILERVLAEGDRSPRNLYLAALEHDFAGRPAEAIPYYLENMELESLAFNPYNTMLGLMDCYQKLEQEDDCIGWGFRAIQWESRRAEAYNKLGLIHYQRQQWERAIPLFTAGAACRPPQNSFEHVYQEHYEWLPHQYLCECYAQLNQLKKMRYHADQALHYNTPHSQRVLALLQIMP